MDEIKSKPHLVMMLLVRRQLIGYMRILQRVSAFYKKHLLKIGPTPLIGPTPKSIETNVHLPETEVLGLVLV